MTRAIIVCGCCHCLDNKHDKEGCLLPTHNLWALVVTRGAVCGCFQCCHCLDNMTREAVCGCCHGLDNKDDVIYSVKQHMYVI